LCYIRNNACWKLEGPIVLCYASHMRRYLRTWYYHLISYNSSVTSLSWPGTWKHAIAACILLSQHMRIIIMHVHNNNDCNFQYFSACSYRDFGPVRVFARNELILPCECSWTYNLWETLQENPFLVVQHHLDCLIHHLGDNGSIINHLKVYIALWELALKWVLNKWFPSCHNQAITYWTPHKRPPPIALSTGQATELFGLKILPWTLAFVTLSVLQLCISVDFVSYTVAWGFMLSPILIMVMCLQLLHVLHMHSLRLTPQCPTFH